MRRLRDRDDGAVAVLVALLAVVLLGLAAFVTDLGLAYSRQRQLQTAADGAALAAAKSFSSVAGPVTSCSAVLSGGAAAAISAAVRFERLNAPPGTSLATGAAPAGWNGDAGVAYRCNAARNIEVQVTNAGASPTFFGALLGASDYDLGTRATAVMGAARSITGLRPFALCSAVVDVLMAAAAADPTQNQLVSINKVFNSSYPAGVDTSCGTASGNWGTLDFDGGNNNAGAATLWTDIGYNEPVDLGGDLQISFPGDPGFPSPNSGNCSTADGCINSGTNLGDALNNILGRPVPLPVFREVSGSGGNATYVVTGFLGVTICGWKVGNSSGTVPTLGGTPCFTPTPALPTGGGSNDNAFQVRVERFTPIGEISDVCGLDAAPQCIQTTLRVLQLVE